MEAAGDQVLLSGRYQVGVYRKVSFAAIEKSEKALAEFRRLSLYRAWFD